MATRTQDISRFFLNYQKLIILIGIALTVQIFLGVRIVFWQGSWDISGDGAKGGPYISKIQGSQKNFAEVVATQNSSLLSLDLESLGFVPGCNITLKDSISAINRAKTQLCKEEIGNLQCDIVEDTLYAKRLPRFCKNTEKKYGRYLGCFKDNPRDRILSGHISVFKDKNSPQVCVDLCLQSGFQYAGLQYGVECFCGNSKPSSSIQIDEDMCDLKCPVGGHYSTSSPLLEVNNIMHVGSCLRTNNS